MKNRLFCVIISIVVFVCCGCSNVDAPLASKNNGSANSSSNMVVSFATAAEEREYWLTKDDYSPEYDSSGDTIETFNVVIDNNTYLDYFEIIIHHDVSLKGYEFTIEDFPGVENIGRIGTSGKVLTREEYLHHNPDKNYDNYYNNYHQEISIYPKEKSIEKIKQMVFQLKQLPFIKNVAFYEKGTGIDCMG